jgi:putative N6-adenine-specific DNA methylase
LALSDETLFISTTPGLEPALEQECRALGLNARGEPGGVNVSGAAGLHRELNVRLRTASRVLMRVADVDASSDKVLGDALKKISLAPFISRGALVEISASAHHARLRAERAELVAREAWKFAAPPRRTREDEELPDATRIQLRLEGARCVVSVDTSGELLYRRGYRQEVSHAPLRETLGAGMLILAGYDGSEPLADPMCGSGTILIEAALIAQRRAPGLERSFAFENFPSCAAEST